MIYIYLGNGYAYICIMPFELEPIDIYLQEKKVMRGLPIGTLLHTLTEYQLKNLILEYQDWLQHYYVDPNANNTNALQQSGNSTMPEQDGTPRT